MAQGFVHRLVLGIALSSVILTLLLSGCISPPYRRPDVSVPLAYRGSAPAPSELRSLGELRWQDLIHDEELSKLIREALANNYDVQIAAARVLEARAQLTIARSARLPSVNAQANYNNLRTSESTGGLGPGESAESDFTNLSVSLGWQLDLWDKSAMPARQRAPACWPASKRGAWSYKRC